MEPTNASDFVGVIAEDFREFFVPLVVYEHWGCFRKGRLPLAGFLFVRNHFPVFTNLGRDHQT
ncbi:hypothetical protein FF011L_09190 [Roseimaritima multifibrata]|uniref:Uncharacterized protein n=1 Tax=Roseimaritima multifibrata TaxID=1930274 RepID=A0A517MBC6_9BACT|nr:hypothetical protein FF011L_09190 [Roseimaritima multifibrata]